RSGAVAATDHTHAQSPVAQMLHQPDHHGRLPGPAQRDVAHHDQRNRGLPAGSGITQVTAATTLGNALVQPLQRPEQPQPSVTPVPGTQQVLLQVQCPPHGAGCSISLVVRRRRLKPSCPAASMAVMTAWWGVFASAVMTTGRLRSLPASRTRAARMLSSPGLTRVLPLMATSPLTEMSTSICC